MTATLEKAFAKAAQLPDAQQETLGRFLLEELEFVAAIQEGVEAADRGDTVPVEEARRRVSQWAFESSSRSRFWHGARGTPVVETGEN
ncbi:MAG: hypothetical protein HZA90_28425 [Verrucomicrobia bacterium]|nr:hypothetical protein [Verrucomicrobiota bacterium]